MKLKQLSLFAGESAPKKRKPETKKLTRAKLAHIDYAIPCPLSFVEATGYCHRCTFFAGGELNGTSATLRCNAEQYKGPEYAYKPGHIHEGWRSIVAWVEEAYET